MRRTGCVWGGIPGIASRVPWQQQQQQQQRGRRLQEQRQQQVMPLTPPPPPTRLCCLPPRCPAAAVLAVHPLCGGDKAATMKRSGFWFLDGKLTWGSQAARTGGRVGPSSLPAVPAGAQAVLSGQEHRRQGYPAFLRAAALGLLCPHNPAGCRQAARPPLTAHPMAAHAPPTAPADCLQRNGSAVQLPSCPPLQWRLPDTETRFFACGQRSLTQLLEYLGVPAPFPSPLPLPPPLLHLPPANAPAPAPAG